MPSPEESPPGEPCVLIGYCDASWNASSVSGGVLMFRGCCVKVFSRKQEVPALSSAEAELYSLVENSKELIAVALLLETILAGIELDALGTPLKLTGSYSLILRNDAQAAISIAQMKGLLRRVRHIELRAKFLQFLVQKRRLILQHVEGLLNPSDGLTKSFKTALMLLHLEKEVGLIPGLNSSQLSWIRTCLSAFNSEEGEYAILFRFSGSELHTPKSSEV
eukprot:s5804_g3.t1